MTTVEYITGESIWKDASNVKLNVRNEAEEKHGKPKPSSCTGNFQNRRP
jgi:hypothetical protein